MKIKRGQNYLLDVIWERTPPPPPRNYEFLTYTILAGNESIKTREIFS